jgi:uncharacterized coiled-coil protein SlyX
MDTPDTVSSSQDGRITYDHEAVIADLARQIAQKTIEVAKLESALTHLVAHMNEETANEGE